MKYDRFKYFGLWMFLLCCVVDWYIQVEIEDHPYLAKSEGVSSIPSFKIYKNGSKIKDIPGNNRDLLESSVKLYSRWIITKTLANAEIYTRLQKETSWFFFGKKKRIKAEESGKVKENEFRKYQCSIMGKINKEIWVIGEYCAVL